MYTPWQLLVIGFTLRASVGVKGHTEHPYEVQVAHIARAVHRSTIAGSRVLRHSYVQYYNESVYIGEKLITSCFELRLLAL